MAGTFNSKTGYLSVTGINVDGGKIVVDGNVFDSEMIGRMISSSISDMNIDSDVVTRIAQAVDLNNFIDSDTIQTIAQEVALNTKTAGYDSDIQELRTKYSTILANDSVQTAELTTAKADILTLSDRISGNDSDITEIKGDVTAVYGRVTTAETNATALTTRVGTLETTVGTTGTGHEGRITTLETTIAALQATIAALTLNDLTDVDLTTNTPTIGDVLEWNGTDWVPVTTS
jgi:hypothetical protein